MKDALMQGLVLGILLAANGPAVAAGGVDRPFVLLISVDGLKPEAILDADGHELRVPNLRALLADGVHATGVRGVLPTLTYPSHMTLLTGVSPATHGIYANTTFDPLAVSYTHLFIEGIS